MWYFVGRVLLIDQLPLPPPTPRCIDKTQSNASFIGVKVYAIRGKFNLKLRKIITNVSFGIHHSLCILNADSDIKAINEYNFI